MAKTKRAALYLRVSTDGQSVENQRLALQAVAAQRGWSVVAGYDDNGISGAQGRDRRPGLDALLRPVAASMWRWSGPWTGWAARWRI
jgi:DNA invertase Pin-like site-specific DNA recombinase